ncbi:endonuclease/exonuclease/phosphatase family protein [Actinopolymorpha sp. B17G11]|uniref:endonuclease/exonuclease/phosphatase family protein n=1 Tax=Actinopolymorpha sp. B17G11 TaxID=3160861 RepID=UPI0032E4A72F
MTSPPTPMRFMAFNIYLGGTRTGGEPNRRQLIEFIRHEQADVVFLVETYGSGATIEAGLNEGLPETHRYQGIQITREPDQAENRDNLWLFTRYPVAEIYPRAARGTVTSFHFGGVRIALPSGLEVSVFTIWLDAAERAWFPTDAAALAHAHGRAPELGADEIAASDEARRFAKARTILDDVLPGLVSDEDAPVVIGGDLNTLSAYDWSARFADAYGHEGLAIPWPVTDAFADAAFTDAYRAVYPDAGTHPGRTWSPYWGFGYAPARIDYVWTRGNALRVTGGHTHTERLQRHEKSTFATEYPFYSDHGALVIDLVVEGGGGAPFGVPCKEVDPTDRPDTPPIGTRIDQNELTVEATSAQPGFEAAHVLVPDPDMFWNSAWDPPAPLPQSLTVDLGRERDLTGLTYVGRLVGRVYEEHGYGAGIDAYEVAVSSNGRTYTAAGRGTLARNRRPQWIPLRHTTGRRVRYLRLTALEGFRGTAGVAELHVYERLARG